MLVFDVYCTVANEFSAVLSFCPICFSECDVGCYLSFAVLSGCLTECDSLISGFYNPGRPGSYFRAQRLDEEECNKLVQDDDDDLQVRSHQARMVLVRAKFDLAGEEVEAELALVHPEKSDLLAD